MFSGIDIELIPVDNCFIAALMDDGLFCRGGGNRGITVNNLAPLRVCPDRCGQTQEANQRCNIQHCKIGQFIFYQIIHNTASDLIQYLAVTLKKTRGESSLRFNSEI